MPDTEELDARWRDGLHVLAAHIGATVPPGAPERVDERMHARARNRVVRRSATGVLTLAAIIALVVVLFGRTSDTGVHTTPAKRDTQRAVVACKPAVSVMSVHALAVLKFSASTYYATAGCVRIRYSGAAGHTLAFDSPGPSAPLLVSAPDHDGNPTSFAWNLEPGTYTFHCTVPGHRSAGMQATLVVR